MIVNRIKLELKLHKYITSYNGITAYGFRIGIAMAKGKKTRENAFLPIKKY